MGANNSNADGGWASRRIRPSMPAIFRDVFVRDIIGPHETSVRELCAVIEALKVENRALQAKIEALAMCEQQQEAA